MSESQAMTHTAGYYNGNPHPIQLMITRLGVTLILQPNEYILDRATKRKINDPFFDHYLQGGLKKETSEEPVPLVRIPEVPPPRQAANPTHSVRGTQQVMPTREAPSVPEVPQKTSTNKVSHVGMSMEEARKLGFIRNTRPVPEDDGVPDTDSGVPPKGTPIKYAVDTVRARKTELPKDLVAEAEGSPLVTQLQRASTQNYAPPSAGFLNEIAHTDAQDSPLQAGSQDTPSKDVTEQAEEVTRESAGVRQLSGQDDDANDDDDDAGDEDTDEKMSPAPDVEVEVDEDEEAEEAALKAPVRRTLKRPASKARSKFVCPVCNAPHKYRSQLVQHAQQSHPSQVQAIMAKFPPR